MEVGKSGTVSLGGADVGILLPPSTGHGKWEWFLDPGTENILDRSCHLGSRTEATPW